MAANKEVSTKKPFSKHKRTRARRSAVQALYQWSISEISVEDVINEFINERTELKKADTDYFREIVSGVTNECECLDEQLILLLDRALDDLDLVEKAILRIGVYELKFHKEIPYKAVLNEAIDLAKMFGAEQSYKYINGVLDKVAQDIKEVEIDNAS